jgi:hypothetical protein
MTAPRELRLSDIRKMMDECAPGYDIRLARHSEKWSLSDKSLFLPKANRGRLEVGYLIKVVSQLEIDKDCATRHFPDVTFR